MSVKMALRSTFRRFLTGSCSASPNLRSPYALSRLYTTLTSPNLFVSGLSRKTTDAKLKEEFSPFGQLVEAKVVTDRTSGLSKGFGFVRYATVDEAEKAREGMNAKMLDGWVVFVDPAKPRERRLPSQPATEPSETGFRTNKTIGWCG